MDFKRLISQAQQEELLTVQERQDQESELLKTAEVNRGRATEEAAAELRRIWLAVFKALLSRRPSHSIMVLDVLRIDELPSRLPETRGWRKSRHIERWNEAADAIAVPAWDMLATFSIDGYYGETYRVVPYEMYLGANGVVYCGPTEPFMCRMHAAWETSFCSAEEVPGAWRPSAAGTGADSYDGRREVAIGLARLVAKYTLEIDTYLS